jgi:hypothetical protein
VIAVTEIQLEIFEKVKGAVMMNMVHFLMARQVSYHHDPDTCLVHLVLSFFGAFVRVLLSNIFFFFA